MSPPLPNSAETILDAAETLASQKGVARLTFEAVAAEAGVSKGGVLHYFGSKDQLIEAMVQRASDRWRDCYMSAYHRQPEGSGRMTRGLLESCLLDDQSWTDSLRRSFASVLAALVHDPSLATSMRQCYADLDAYLLNDGLPEGVAIAIGAAIDGIWTKWAMGLTDVDHQKLRLLHAALVFLLEQSLKDVEKAPARGKSKNSKA